MRTPLLLVFVAALGLSACDGCAGSTSRRFGEVRLGSIDATGAVTAGEDAVIDFGRFWQGATVQRELAVTNVGLGSLTLRSFQKVSGDAVSAGPAVSDASPVFTVEFSGELGIAAGETVGLPVAFSPPRTGGATAYEVRLDLSSGGTERGTAALTLRGVGVPGECELPAVLDFGGVMVGKTLDLGVTFANNANGETAAYLGEVESQQGSSAFSLAPDAPRGDFTLAPHGTRTVTVTFAPTALRDFFASVRMRAASGCPERVVRLIGSGVGRVLSWTPTEIDYVFAPVGAVASRRITFSSLSARPIEVSQLAILDPAFAVAETGTSDLTKLVVPAATRGANNELVAGEATLRVEFRPTARGPFASPLGASAPLAGLPTLRVPLRGVGGGPDLEVTPRPTLDFGNVSFLPTANPPLYATQALTLRNAGTRPNPTVPEANLYLGHADGGTGGARPYWRVTPKNGALASELCVGAFDPVTRTCADDLATTGLDGYDPAQGLVADSQRALLELPVRVIPNGLGRRDFDVTLFSSDPDEPEVTVAVTATAVPATPCDLEVTPTEFPLGVLTPPQRRDVVITLHNRDPVSTCRISNLRLRAELGTPQGFPAIFTLPNGPRAELLLGPGERHEVLVRAWPQGVVSLVPQVVLGRLAFDVTDPANPQREVRLTATVAQSCLTISPDSFDFGTREVGCSAPTRTFTLTNTCGADVVINDATMEVPAGLPAGAPGCPGPGRCPEFLVATGLPPGTVVSSRAFGLVTFSLSYRPVDLGPDLGAFVLNTTQAGQVFDYVLPLRGRGDTQGLNTDTFVQPSSPKADVLFVIDDSCSMADKQAALGSNFTAFIDAATQNAVDFQLAVTTTGPDDGAFVTSPGGFRMLRPSTPNVAQVFSSLVQVGIGGNATESCMGPTTRALTAPYINDPALNAGFLRFDATLTVVCVTDARDQATELPSHFLSQLMNLKGAQRPGLFTYNVIGPFLPSAPAGCSYDGLPDDGRHAYLVAQTGGVQEEICTPDWSAAMANVGRNAFSYQREYFLTARPDLGSDVEVRLDGQVVPAGPTSWAYDVLSNSVRFEPLATPAPGRRITVTYRVACLP